MLRMSRMLAPGTQAPDFALIDTGGVKRTLADVRGEKWLDGQASRRGGEDLRLSLENPQRAWE